MSRESIRTLYVPTLEEVDDTLRSPDPAQRNLRITQTYHDLKIALSRELGTRNVNWCAFATWASKTAGRFIRGEILPASLLLEEAGEGDPVLRPVTRAVAEAVEPALLEVRRHLAQGNFIVFEEIAPIFTRMVWELGQSSSYDPVALRRFLSHLRPGHVSEGGQEWLITAFTRFYEARFERTSRRRAELIFMANALVGYHEQTRLQGSIMAALTAPVRETLRATLGAAFRRLERLGLPERIRALVRGLSSRLADRLEARFRELSTRWLVTLELPAYRLDMGQDVPRLPDGRMFPEELHRLEHPELRALVEVLDRTPDTSRGSAAKDWASLPDRMNYVVDFFRSRQQDPTLFHPPFSPEQVAEIRAGRMPGGAL